MKRISFLLLLFSLIAACGPKAPSQSEQIRIAVEQTLAAIPTDTPNPPPHFPPTPTPISLSGLFCEYEFCIGHPPDMAFYDAVAKQYPNSPQSSAADHGIIATQNDNLFIEVIWQTVPNASDPQFMLDVIMNDAGDTRNGNLDPLQVGDLSVLFVPITPTQATSLRFGGAAAWTCDGRAFAWKAYTPQADLAKNLLIEALQQFRCNAQR